MGLIQKIKDLFFKPNISDQERIDRWHKEAEEKKRLELLHREARKQIMKKNKTLSSNF
tara:strand:+ start:2249 stop:2422 length:174 start_codon:yes stop_codon:yes gene_type:complete